MGLGIDSSQNEIKKERGLNRIVFILRLNKKHWGISDLKLASKSQNRIKEILFLFHKLRLLQERQSMKKPKRHKSQYIFVMNQVYFHETVQIPDLHILYIRFQQLLS